MVLRVGWGQDPECEGEGVRVSVGVRGRVHVVVTCGAWARRCGWGPCRRLGVGGEGKAGSRRRRRSRDVGVPPATLDARHLEVDPAAPGRATVGRSNRGPGPGMGGRAGRCARS